MSCMYVLLKVETALQHFDCCSFDWSRSRGLTVVLKMLICLVQEGHDIKLGSMA